MIHVLLTGRLMDTINWEIRLSRRNCAIKRLVPYSIRQSKKIMNLASLALQGIKSIIRETEELSVTDSFAKMHDVNI